MRPDDSASCEEVTASSVITALYCALEMLHARRDRAQVLRPSLNRSRIIQIRIIPGASPFLAPTQGEEI